MDKTKPNIPAVLLWEYDYDKFDFEKSYKIVIERVLQLGNLKEWKEIFNYYGEGKIIETIEWSKQLIKRDKEFSMLFLNSIMLHAH